MLTVDITESIRGSIFINLMCHKTLHDIYPPRIGPGNIGRSNNTYQYILPSSSGILPKLIREDTV